MRGAKGEIRNSRSLSATNRLSKGRGAAANLILVLRGSSKSDPVSKDDVSPVDPHARADENSPIGPLVQYERNGNERTGI